MAYTYKQRMLRYRASLSPSRFSEEFSTCQKQKRKLTSPVIPLIKDEINRPFLRKIRFTNLAQLSLDLFYDFPTRAPKSNGSQRAKHAIYTAILPTLLPCYERSRKNSISRLCMTMQEVYAACSHMDKWQQKRCHVRREIASQES